MAARYAYDLDHNNRWRWVAIADSGELAAVSPVGYADLQDCLHAVGLMQAPGNLSVTQGVQQEEATEPPPERSLSRLRRRA